MATSVVLASASATKTGICDVGFWASGVCDGRETENGVSGMEKANGVCDGREMENDACSVAEIVACDGNAAAWAIADESCEVEATASGVAHVYEVVAKENPEPFSAAVVVLLQQERETCLEIPSAWAMQLRRAWGFAWDWRTSTATGRAWACNVQSSAFAFFLRSASQVRHRPGESWSAQVKDYANNALETQP